MSKDFSYLRHWITGEGYGPDTPSRPVILECIPSRSGMSMAVYDRGKRIFTVNGCGFDRVGTALGEFLEACSQPELRGAWSSALVKMGAYSGHGNDDTVYLDGASGFESMSAIAQAIGLKVHQSESKAGTLLIIEKGN